MSKRYPSDCICTCNCPDYTRIPCNNCQNGQHTYITTWEQ